MILNAYGLLNVSEVIINASIFSPSFNSAIGRALSKIPSCLQCSFKPERNCFSNSIHTMSWNPFFSTHQIIFSGCVWSQQDSLSPHHNELSIVHTQGFLAIKRDIFEPFHVRLHIAFLGFVACQVSVQINLFYRSF